MHAQPISKDGALRNQRLFHWGTLLFACILLIAVKSQTLNLPHHWDEAFPYSYAIGHMVDHGPSMLAGRVPPEFTTGHPLLYYFLQSSWNLSVGDAIWMQRMLPLLISVGCILMVYLLGSALFNRAIGAGASLLLSTQSTFLANSTFQLPETLLTLMLLCCMYFMISGKRWFFVASASLMLFVKEPAVVLLGIIFVYHFFIHLKRQSLIFRVRETWVYILPFALNGLFYLHQHSIYGWFFFPRHTGFVEFSMAFFSNQFKRYSAHLFIQSGRNAMLFSSLLLGIFYLIRHREKFEYSEKIRNGILVVILVLGSLVFSAFNFYSNRYILCLFPLFCLLVSALLYYTLTRFKSQFFHVAIISLACVTLFYSFKNSNPNDHSLGYADAVRCQQQAINFCIDQGWQHQPIQTGFLMHKYFTSHYPRYLDETSVFTNVNKTPITEATVFVLHNNEKVELDSAQIKSLKLVQRFIEGKSVCEIYRVR